MSTVCATKGFQNARVHRQLCTYLRGIAKKRMAIAAVIVVADGIVQFPRLQDVDGAGASADATSNSDGPDIHVGGGAVAQFDAPSFRKVLHFQLGSSGLLEFETLSSEGNSIAPQLID